ncbi:outer membrane protein transport protein [Shewanella yunxiaonensis]|uniref:Outer membrane protein transport protein n=1 Tax=Shewanella yunxiaonensis TaxID=2829809 RepID=A0ABX7YVF1_9GAMM|nr:outer membrane protein transport protein [Shewanella yunxiaonensis]QUN06126.1 outer membrane protein transport protein [Shewanella yunxiaonensis]
MKKQKITLAISIAILGIAAQTQVQAAGFQLAESSATGLGRAFAGEGASAENASVQARNPAMLSYLEGRQMSVGAVYVMPSVSTPGTLTIDSALLPQSISMNADVDDVANNALVPNFYYSSQLNDRWTWGLAINSNYGLSTELDSTAAAAIFGNKTSVTTVEVNPNIAYRIDQRFTVGGGLRYVYGKGEIGASTPGWISAVGAYVPSLASSLPPAGTELKYLKGDDYGYGYQVGASWQIDPNNRIGVSYHSKVDLTLSGHASGLLYTGGSSQVDGYLPLELPAFAELSSFHQLTDNWSMQASVNWTDWSVFDELVAYFPGEQKPLGNITSDVVKEEHFKDNWRFALGTMYHINESWLLRAGVALDKTAVSDENRTITIPDSDRHWVSVGVGYAATKNLNIDLGVSYLRTHGSAPINETQNMLGLAQVTFDGESTGHVWLAGLQVSYKI